ncbi:MAG: nicotinamide riboside transporter PnuC [Clostridiales bacterium]|nr:nicotinamide riboside transporter PnuC [Clostridiales bacterium]
MDYLIKPFRDFTKLDIIIWTGSVTALIISFAASGGGDALTLIASLIGVTSLIFIAKGNVIGQFLMILFAVIYSIISFTFHYYGEMVTYMCMTAPSALITAIAWIKNPYSETQVAVGEVRWRGWLALVSATVAITIIFYFILAALDTPNLFFSTISVTTSFLAAGLMFLRSQYYATGYMANDLILVILWILASLEDISYLPMVVNFAIFFINDLYGYISWSRMKKVQSAG